MAVFNSFTFDDKNSLDYGVYITGEVYNAPARVVEMISIPGRDGDIALDQGRFENIEVTYHAGAFGASESGFAAKMRAFRNMLASRFNYVKLINTYHPDEYRLALYKSGLDVSSFMSISGEFDIVFECKPHRYLKSGDTEVEIGKWIDYETETGESVTIEATDLTIIKDLKTDIDTIQQGAGTQTPTNIRPFRGMENVKVQRNGTEYLIALGRKVYGGTLDVTTGQLVLNKVLVAFDGTEDWVSNTGNSVNLDIADVYQPADMIGDRYVKSDSAYEICWRLLQYTDVVGGGRVGTMRTRR